MPGTLHESGLQIRYKPLGHFTVSVGTSVEGLPSLPTENRLRRIVIRNLDQPICWRDDGTDPTGTSGMLARPDEIVVYDANEPENFKMVRAASATANADVRIAYYGT